MFISDSYNNSTRVVETENNYDKDDLESSNEVDLLIKTKNTSLNQSNDLESILPSHLIKKLKNEIEKDLQDFFRTYLRGLIPYYIKRMEKDVLIKLEDQFKTNVNNVVKHGLTSIENHLYDVAIKMEDHISENISHSTKKLINQEIKYFESHNDKIYKQIDYTTIMIDDMTKEIARLNFEVNQLQQHMKHFHKNDLQKSSIKKHKYYRPHKKFNPLRVDSSRV